MKAAFQISKLAFLIFSIASLGANAFTTATGFPSGTFTLEQVQCSYAGAPFKARKVVAAAKDQTTLTFIPQTERTGAVHYEAVHWGLMGGDCQISFKADAALKAGEMAIRPRRATLKIKQDEYVRPCQTLRADQDPVYKVARQAQTLRLPEMLVLEGDDFSQQCPGSDRSTKVRFTFLKSESSLVP